MSVKSEIDGFKCGNANKSIDMPLKVSINGVRKSIFNLLIFNL